MSDEISIPTNAENKQEVQSGPYSPEALHKSTVFAKKAGQASIDELVETIRPTITSFMIKHDIRVLSMSTVAGDGSSSSHNFIAPDPENMDSEETSEWEKQKNQALFGLSLEFSKTKYYFDQLIRGIIANGS
jgi:hypothetical protein